MLKKIGASVMAGVLTATLLAGCANGTGSGNSGDKKGHPAMDTVAGGTVMTSDSYRLVLTTGQGPGSNGVSTSSNHQLHGGLVGATQ